MVSRTKNVREHAHERSAVHDIHGTMRRSIGVQDFTFSQGENMKGQISTELIVVVAVVLVIFLPLLVMVYFKANEANEQIGAYQAELAAFRLAYLANSVGSLGTNASITTDVYIPPGVTNITAKKVGKGGEIILKVQTPAGESEIVEVVKYPFVFEEKKFSASQGWARFTITSEYVGGEAQLKIETTRK